MTHQPGDTINKAIKILLFFLFTVNTASALWTPLFAVFVTGHVFGATLVTVGLMGAIYSVSKSFLQIVVSKRLDARVGERDDFAALFSGILLACFCSFSLLFVGNVWQLGFIQLLWGIADAFTMAAYYALFSHHVDKKLSSFEWSLFSVGGVTSAAAIGGLVGGMVAEAYGFSVIFITAGTLNVLSLLLLLALYPQIRRARILR